MQFSCGIVTYNSVSSNRFRLLKQTVVSLLTTFPRCVPVYVLDNGSEDESPTKIRKEFGDGPRIKQRFMRHPDGNHTPGRGRNCLLDWMIRDNDGAADAFVFSDDDMFWHEDAGEKLDAIYGAPRDPLISIDQDTWDAHVAIVCGYLEPDFDWATTRCRLEPGGVPVIIRDSVPGAAWTFRVNTTPNWPVVHGIAPAYKAWRSGGEPPFAETFGYDHKLCTKLREARLAVAAADLCDHLGRGRSTHGNEPITGSSRPLDRKKWRI